MKKNKKIIWAFLAITGLCIILVLAKPTIAQEEKSINITSVGFSANKCPTPYFIDWTSTGSIESVKIVLLEGNVLVYTIAQATPNDGSHSWDFAEEITGYYNISVSDISNPNINDIFAFQYDTTIIICLSIDSYPTGLILIAIGIILIPIIVKLSKKFTSNVIKSHSYEICILNQDL